MKNLSLAVFLCLLSFVGIQSKAQNYDYYMRGSQTDLWDQDVDYFAHPITLHRTKDTVFNHSIDFNVARYEQVCLAVQYVCVAHDQHGNCTAYEERCVQWGVKAYAVPKRIHLDFHDLPALTGEEEETYQLIIYRTQPAGPGEDFVSTDLSPLKTKIPTKVFKMGDFSYRLDPKN